MSSQGAAPSLSPPNPTTPMTLMATIIYSFLFSLLFIFPFLPSSSTAYLLINVADFGATAGDGNTDSSPSFVRAWIKACTSNLPTTIYIPPKRYFIRPVIFQGPCTSSNITLHLDGILVAPDDYIDMGSNKNWFTFTGVNGLSIVGGGYLDGQGARLWSCKGTSSRKCPPGATSLAVYGSKDVLIRNITLIDAKLYHIVIHSCKNVKIEGVRIYAPENSPNTDGIHIQNAVNVRVLKTGIQTGDDCISIGPGTKNLHINRVMCGPGHGISIGSLGKGLEEDGVLNVTVKNAVFTGTTNGLRIKSWGRPSNGFVKGVVFKQVVMKNVENPIVIDQNYCPWYEGCPDQNSGIKISHVTYSNIKGTSASQVAMKFDCSATSPCRGIGLKDIQLTYQRQPAQSFCRNIHGIARGVITPPSCL